MLVGLHFSTLSLILLCLICSACSAPPKVECKREQDVPEQFRIDHYRAPTPSCVPHAVTINTAEVQQLIADKNPILIDVLGVLTRPIAGFDGGHWLPNKPRYSLPNAVWLPNVGYGMLDDEMLNYFQSQLINLTQGDKNKPLVFFCIADCWMSWNAVKHAHSYGYSNLYWYKNGTDGWLESELKVVKVDPVPLTELDSE